MYSIVLNAITVIFVPVKYIYVDARKFVAIYEDKKEAEE